MFGSRKLPRFDRGAVVGERSRHRVADVSEASNEFGDAFGQAEHVVHDEDLAVAGGRGADADGGDGNGFGDALGQRLRDRLQHDGEGTRLRHGARVGFDGGPLRLRAPLRLDPPNVLIDCGVKPMCAMTGIPRSTKKRIVGAKRSPPSSFTAPQSVSFRMRTALRNAASGPSSYVPNGMSTTTNARCVPRTTARPWTIIWSSVTGTVEAYPCITMPTLSPTRRKSTWGSARAAVLDR